MTRLTLEECLASGRGVLFDTSVLIDAWRASQKHGNLWTEIERQCPNVGQRQMSSVSAHEMLADATKLDERLRELRWAKERFTPMSLSREVDEIFNFYLHELPPPEGRRSLADWLIAASAEASNLALATFNEAHFVRFEELGLVLVRGLPRASS